MGQDKITELFFEYPSREFYLREIAKITKIPKSTVARILSKLQKQKMIIRKKYKPFDRYAANTENSMYIFYKKFHIIEKIQKSGLIDYIVDKVHPKTIVVFGSCAKGEDTKESDIDLFVASSEAELNLSNFKLVHPVNIIFNTDLLHISKELRSNIINGIKLYGVLRI